MRPQPFTLEFLFVFFFPRDSSALVLFFLFASVSDCRGAVCREFRRGWEKTYHYHCYCIERLSARAASSFSASASAASASASSAATCAASPPASLRAREPHERRRVEGPQGRGCGRRGGFEQGGGRRSRRGVRGEVAPLVLEHARVGLRLFFGHACVRERLRERERERLREFFFPVREI